MTETDMSQFRDRIVLVTGATRGIGHAAAMAFGAAGAHVICLGRTVGALEELDDDIQAAGGSATLVPLDMNDGDGLDRLGAAIFERWQKLDILIASAGVLGPLSPVTHIDVKHFDPVIDVNIRGNWRLLRSMAPLLAASDAGRAVFLTSGAAYRNRAYWGPYAMTKAALNAMVATYADEIVHTPVRANLLSPGATRTRMRAEAMPGENPDTLPAPDEIVPSILHLCDRDLTRSGQVFDHRAGTFRKISPLDG